MRVVSPSNDFGWGVGDGLQFSLILTTEVRALFPEVGQLDRL